MWRALVDVATGVLALAVGVLVRWVLSLRDRVTRLETLLDDWRNRP